MISVAQEELDDTFVCGCNADQRSACDGLPFYEVHTNRGYCVLHFPSNDKEPKFHEVLENKIQKGDFDFRGVWFPSLSSRFRAFRFPSKADFSRATFGKRADFSSAVFESESSFAQATFVRRRASFYEATFEERADFSETEFRGGVTFLGATFDQVDFSKAVLRGKANFTKVRFAQDARYFRTTFCRTANFSATTFAGRSDFSEAQFAETENDAEGAKFIDTAFEGPASFWQARFHGAANFYKAAFNDKVTFVKACFDGNINFRTATFGSDGTFGGDKDNRVFNTSARTGGFQYARVSKPDRLSFQTISLRPNWFINTDARSFNFVDVEWHGSFDEELEATRAQASSPYTLLAKTYRELATNAENNHRYPEAGQFSYQALDTQRKEHWRGLAPWRLDFWYWAFSGYSERQFLAGSWLLVILFLFAGLYTWFGFPAGRCEGLLACGHTFVTQAVPYSLGVMSLQSPTPKPDVGIWQFVVFTQGVWGPLQLALFALSLRRRFMR